MEFVDENVEIRLVTACVLICILAAAGLLSGWGGWMRQTDDWTKHNALLEDLITRKWPVFYRDAADPSMLSYYIGFYLVPAAVGKLMGWSFRVAEIMMYIWGETGLLLLLLNLIRAVRAKQSWQQISAVFVLILFGGCLILAQNCYELLGGPPFYGEDWMIRSDEILLQYSSNFTCLQWVVPQFLPVCLIMTIWWDHRESADYLAGLLLPAFLDGAISFLGLVGIGVIWLFLEPRDKGIAAGAWMRKLLSPANVVGILSIGVLLLMYYAGNILSEKDPAVSLGVQHLSPGLYISFTVFHFGLYCVLSWKENKGNSVFVGSVLLLMVLPFFRMGFFNDLVMRASIPGMFGVMLAVLVHLFESWRSFSSGALIVLLCVGAIGPLKDMSEALRTYEWNTLQTSRSVRSLAEYSNRTEGALDWRYNYYCYDPDEDFFVKYIAANNGQ